VLSFFLPDFSGHSEASGGCSQTKGVLSTGDRKNFFRLALLASPQAIRIEIVAVVPLKAERTPVPGRRVSPEAVPEKGGAKRNDQELFSYSTDQPITLERCPAANSRQS
jgi:hypothetical protein